MFDRSETEERVGEGATVVFPDREIRERENRRGRCSDMYGYACGVLLCYFVLLQEAAT